ncbi:modulator of DNA gyrase family protein [Candidatus Phytoplasma oryzae]|uniref:Modulator of DNA gyrase family protein n=1 Tax=Candidatus Phytoplasma oryzae TaxID=203274 RepID=A0A139JRD0_9MOLU|nr:TldD/PmbA family protein [Candidatus Phytoplasma oryzae]KXT29436.1 modulator of DNA gyrase family protein [Candidatus Phytoplasma oryzae]RAM58017.1 peptidase C69 [Candidatus Phytoplasma oryzae]
MLNKIEINNILKTALKQGFDFIELFFEDTIYKNLKIINKKIISYNSGNIFGVGIRLLKNTKEVYIYTNEVNYQTILNLIKEQKKYSCEKNIISLIPLGKSKIFKNEFKKPFNSVTTKEKTQKMIDLSTIMMKYSDYITKTIVNMEEKEQKVLIINSKGVYQNDFRPYIKCSLTSIAQKKQNLQEFHDSIGRSMGLEFFDVINLKEKALKVAQNAVILLDALELKPQNMPVVINNGVGGVIFHEACGHSLEATAVAKGLSPFCGKINQKIASELITAFDDGNISTAWGKLNFDDEGNKTQKNLLIKNGILKNYLIDYRNSLRMKMPPTGSSRRESYKYSPTSRMNSTYIAPGKHKPEDIIKDTSYGLYAQNLGGGTVSTATGEFNFMVNLGYLIEKGKITKPVKGMMLIGYGQEILLKIDRVGNDLNFSQGYCGSISGYIPVDLGQPTIRVTKMIVGGGKNE